MKFHSRIATGVLLLLLAGALGLFTVLPGEVARLKNPVAAPPSYPVSAAAASLHRGCRGWVNAQG